MKSYDLIAVLGYGFVADWKLSEHVHKRLETAAELYRKGVAKKIAVCGRWSLGWEQKHITPPTTEAEEMKKVLVGLGVAEEDILKEDFSQDTIGNAFFLKTKIVEMYGYKHMLIVCADYALERVKYLFHKIFEATYTIDFLPTPTPYKNDKDILTAQKDFLNVQKEFLKTMKRGDTTFLASRLYDDPYYQVKRPEKIIEVALGGTQ